MIQALAARAIDLRDRYVLPGVIDLHVHLVGINTGVSKFGANAQ